MGASRTVIPSQRTCRYPLFAQPLFKTCPQFFFFLSLDASLSIPRSLSLCISLILSHFLSISLSLSISLYPFSVIFCHSLSFSVLCDVPLYLYLSCRPSVDSVMEVNWKGNPGTVKFVGKVDFAAEEMVGIELDPLCVALVVCWQSNPEKGCFEQSSPRSEKHQKIIREKQKGNN